MGGNALRVKRENSSQTQVGRFARHVLTICNQCLGVSTFSIVCVQTTSPQIIHSRGMRLRRPSRSVGSCCKVLQGAYKVFAGPGVASLGFHTYS